MCDCASARVHNNLLCDLQVRNQAFVTPPTYQLIYGNLTNQYNGTITVKLNQYVVVVVV